MSIFEYNEEEEMKKIRADEYSIGVEAGRAEGKAEGTAEAILELLEDLDVIPAALRKRILSETNLTLLKKWHKEAARAGTLREFIEKAELSGDI